MGSQEKWAKPMTDGAPFVRGPLTAAEKVQIDLLAERLKAGQIAQRLHRHPSTVYGYMITRGLQAPGTKVKSPHSRNGWRVIPFTPEEDAFIERHRTLNATFKRIADLAASQFGHRRTASTICFRLKTIAAREDAQ